MPYANDCEVSERLVRSLREVIHPCCRSPWDPWSVFSVQESSLAECVLAYLRSSEDPFHAFVLERLFLVASVVDQLSLDVFLDVLLKVLREDPSLGFVWGGTSRGAVGLPLSKFVPTDDRLASTCGVYRRFLRRPLDEVGRRVVSTRLKRGSSVLVETRIVLHSEEYREARRTSPTETLFFDLLDDSVRDFDWVATEQGFYRYLSEQSKGEAEREAHRAIFERYMGPAWRSTLHHRTTLHQARLFGMLLGGRLDPSCFHPDCLLFFLSVYKRVLIRNNLPGQVPPEEVSVCFEPLVTVDQRKPPLRCADALAACDWFARDFHLKALLRSSAQPVACTCSEGARCPVVACQRRVTGGCTDEEGEAFLRLSDPLEFLGRRWNTVLLFTESRLWPTKHGYQSRVLQFLEHFSRASREVVVMSPDTEPQAGIRVVKGVEQVPAGVDLVFWNKVPSNPEVLLRVRKRCPTAHFCVDVHDHPVVNTFLQNLCRGLRGTSRYLDESFCNRVMEVVHFFPAKVPHLDFFDTVISISRSEALSLAPFVKATHLLVPPSTSPPRARVRTEPRYALFVASDNVFNRQAHDFLVEKVLPLLPPDFPVAVFGGVSNVVVKSSSINYLKEDLDLREVYRSAFCTLCPLLLGTGAKVKIFESLSFGVPCVAHASCAPATGLVHGKNGYVAHTALEHASFISSLRERVCVPPPLSKKSEVGTPAS